jgi:hypothetical protein
MIAFARTARQHAAEPAQSITPLKPASLLAIAAGSRSRP